MRMLLKHTSPIRQKAPEVLLRGRNDYLQKLV